jgi:Divergent InlB B-repeat domain
VSARAKWSKRLAVSVIGALVAVGLVAASAPSKGPLVKGVLNAELQLVTAGPGTLTVSPAENAASADCKTDAQQYESSSEDCIQHYESGTRVTLTAVPDDGHTFAGWSDFGCAAKSTTCQLVIRSGTRYVAARFSPVTLQLFVPGEHPFGLISVSPKPLNTCSLNDGDKCEFKSGTTVLLTREFAAPGFFWVGSCDGNKGGLLDAKTCKLRLGSNEAVGAGYAQAGEIPPPLGSGIVVVVAGKGKVTGTVINGTQTLDCGTRCSVSGLIRYDQVRLTATPAAGSYLYRWSNLGKLRLKTQTVALSSTNRIQAVFRKR